MTSTPESLSDLKLKQKKISRQIGQAKQKGENIDALLAEIQSLSTHIKSIEAQAQADAQRDSQLSDNTSSSPTSDPFALPCVKINSTAQTCASPAITIRVFQPLIEDDAAIEHYLDKHPGSSPYHRPCVFRTLQTTFLHSGCYWIATRGDTLCGVLPLLQLNSKLFGNYAVSMPFFNYGGVLADDHQVAQRLLNDALVWGKARGVQHIEYRYAEPTPFGLPHKTDKVSFYLSLPSTADTLYASFKSKLRSQIKKALSYPHQARQGGVELLDDFYRVFSENMRDLGTPVYAKKFFHNLANTLNERLCFIVIYYDNQPAAAALLIGHKQRLEIPWASTLRKYNPKSANMLLYWRVLQWAIAEQYTVFDFGRCSTDAGTYKFKAQWGATERPLYWDYHLLDGKMPALNTKNAKYKLLIAGWKRLPLFIANRLGPPLVKYLP